MDSLIQLPQFEKMEKKRKNAKHPVLKEEERITDILKDLKDKKCISDNMYNRLKPSGSQPPRLYGLAKVHKKDTPLRPVLSMPGSAYNNVAKQVAKWLSHVPECNINTSTKAICDSLRTTQLNEDEELVSFDVTSLYTNVPVKEAIEVCTDLLFKKCSLPVNRETFITLAEIASCNVIMSTHDGYYKQTDGLAMGSPPAPHLANGWMSQFDPIIKDTSPLYARYIDDILCGIPRDQIENKLNEINMLHPDLKFTLEQEKNNSIPFLDMKILNSNGSLSSTWYTKPTDTGLIMNFHALAPKRYKRSVVSGFVHRIHRACSSWKSFHDSLDKAKQILEQNQYPSSFYEPIVYDALNKILTPKDSEVSEEESEHSVSEEEAELASTPEDSNSEDSVEQNPTTSTHEMQEKDKFMLFVQYRGKCTEEYAQNLHKVNAPCRIVMTLRKLKTVLVPLKPSLEFMMRSNVVYKITCPRCNACYVGQTSRQLQRRFSEHLTRKGPVKAHMTECHIALDQSNVQILGSTARGEKHLLTLEALFQNELKPTLNTKDEYKSRTLTIKF